MKHGWKKIPRPSGWDFIAVITAYAAISAGAGHSFDQARPGTLDVRGITIRDPSGRERIHIGVTRDGNAGLAILNPRGSQTVSLGALLERSSGFSLENSETQCAIGCYIGKDGAAGLASTSSRVLDPGYLLELRQDGLIGERFFERPRTERRNDSKFSIEDLSRVETYVSTAGSAGFSLKGTIDKKVSLSTAATPVGRVDQSYGGSDRELAIALGIASDGRAYLELLGSSAHPRCRFLCQGDGSSLVAFSDEIGQWKAFAQSIEGGRTILSLGGLEPLPRIEVGFDQAEGKSPRFLISGAFAAGNLELGLDTDRGPTLRLHPRAGRRP